MARSHSRGILYSEPPGEESNRRADATDDATADSVATDEPADATPTPADD
jgi:hypothetical protein